jgi:oligoendopeptidase F
LIAYIAFLSKTFVRFMESSAALKIPQRKKRHFIPDVFDFTGWEDVKPFYEHLKNLPVNSALDLRNWFLNRSELESFLSENFAWRYIRMTCDTANTDYIDQLNFFIAEVQPHMAAYSNELDKKALASPFLNELAPV